MKCVLNTEFTNANGSDAEDEGSTQHGGKIPRGVHSLQRWHLWPIGVTLWSKAYSQCQAMVWLEPRTLGPQIQGSLNHTTVTVPKKRGEKLQARPSLSYWDSPSNTHPGPPGSATTLWPQPRLGSSVYQNPTHTLRLSGEPFYPLLWRQEATAMILEGSLHYDIQRLKIKCLDLPIPLQGYETKETCTWIENILQKTHNPNTQQ